MKKNIKVLIAAIVCVAVLAVGLVVVLNLPENEEITENTSDDAILIFDKSNIIAEDITISNESGEYRLLGYDYTGFEPSESESSGETSETEIKMIYTMQEYETQQLSKTMTDSLVEQCSYMAALKVVDKSGERDSEYGLDNPVSTVIVVYSDGSTVTMYIGNDAPDNKGVYFKTDRSNTVYLVQKNMINMFLVDKLQMFVKNISYSFDTYAEIQTVNLTGTLYEKDIYIKPLDNNANFCNFVMESPYREICDNEFFESFGESLYGVDGTTVIAVDITEDDIAEYGLDEPYMDITVTADDESSVHIVVSEPDDDNKCYIMKYDGTIIYQTDTEEISWYGVTYRDFLADSIVVPNMSNLIGVDISLDGKDYHYDITHTVKLNEVYEEIIDNQALYNGKEISYLNMSTFANNIAGITRSESLPENLDGCTEIFSVKFTFDGDTQLTDTLKMYKTTDNQTVVVLNDNIEGYTDSEYAKKVMAQVEEISESKQLETLTDENQIEISESSEVVSE